MREREWPQPLEKLHPAAESAAFVCAKMLGPYAERRIQADGIGGRMGADAAFGAAGHRHRRACLVDAHDPDGHEVHRRRSDRLRHPDRGGRAIERERLADLFHMPVRHHDDAVRERHRLDLVVRHVDHRRAEPLMQSRELVPHLHAQARVEVRQGFVEQEHCRVADDRAADRHALSLPARQGPGPPIQQRAEFEQLGHLANLGRDLVPAALRHAKGKGDVLRNGQMRVESV